MKTVDLTRGSSGVAVTLELNELELTILTALVEQGQQQLRSASPSLALHGHMAAVANEFRSLLGHLELLAADE